MLMLEFVLVLRFYQVLAEMSHSMLEFMFAER